MSVAFDFHVAGEACAVAKPCCCKGSRNIHGSANSKGCSESHGETNAGGDDTCGRQKLEC